MVMDAWRGAVEEWEGWRCGWNERAHEMQSELDVIRERMLGVFTAMAAPFHSDHGEAEELAGVRSAASLDEQLCGAVTQVLCICARASEERSCDGAAPGPCAAARRCPVPAAVSHRRVMAMAERVEDVLEQHNRWPKPCAREVAAMKQRQQQQQTRRKQILKLKKKIEAELVDPDEVDEEEVAHLQVCLAKKHEYGEHQRAVEQLLEYMRLSVSLYPELMHELAEVRLDLMSEVHLPASGCGWSVGVVGAWGGGAHRSAGGDWKWRPTIRSCRCSCGVRV
jgi:hypothetical protein